MGENLVQQITGISHSERSALEERNKRITLELIELSKKVEVSITENKMRSLQIKKMINDVAYVCTKITDKKAFKMLTELLERWENGE